MGEIEFDWDEANDRSNHEKHGVSFREAATVFVDQSALLIEDPDHSITEQRFIILGMSRRLRILVVVHCFREQQGVIRLISARKATKNEMKSYGKGGSDE